MTAKSQGVFVRGLWGEGEDGERPTLTLPKTLQDIQNSLAAKFQPEPLIVYCWGTENQNFLKSHEVESIPVSKRPIENYSGDPETPRGDIDPVVGRVNYGVSMWRHKLESLCMALQIHQQVVWLDWDVHQVQAIPNDFWSILRAGPEIQAALRGYRRPQCPWRPRRGRGLVVHGGFIYCRSLLLIERVIEIHSTKFPTYTDETPISYVIDDMMHGWTNADAFLAAGFEPQCYDQRKRNIHPRSENPVFQNRGQR